MFVQIETKICLVNLTGLVEGKSLRVGNMLSASGLRGSRQLRPDTQY